MRSRGTLGLDRDRAPGAPVAGLVARADPDVVGLVAFPVPGHRLSGGHGVAAPGAAIDAALDLVVAEARRQDLEPGIVARPLDPDSDVRAAEVALRGADDLGPGPRAIRSLHVDASPVALAGFRDGQSEADADVALRHDDRLVAGRAHPALDREGRGVVEGGGRVPGDDLAGPVPGDARVDDHVEDVAAVRLGVAEVPGP